MKLQPAARITVDPNIRGGVPCVGGNWPITFILEAFADGISTEQIIQTYEGLTLADIQLALRAAAVVMEDPIIDWVEYDLHAMLDFREEMEAWQALSAEALDKIENSPDL